MGLGSEGAGSEVWQGGKTWQNLFISGMVRAEAYRLPLQMFPSSLHILNPAVHAPTKRTLTVPKVRT